jgi:hypothetical protein
MPIGNKAGRANVEELVYWITDMERKARRVYQEGRDYFAGEKGFSAFLRHLLRSRPYTCK